MLWQHLINNRLKLSYNYGLTGAGEIANQLYPALTGYAMNGAINGDYKPLGILLIGHVAITGIGLSAKIVDTKVFTRIHAELANRIIKRGHDAGLLSSKIIGQSVLIREYIIFLERDVPDVLRSIIAFVIALGFLFWFRPSLGSLCLLLLLPHFLCNRWLVIRSSPINRKLNRRTEGESLIITNNKSRAVRRHFSIIAAWRVQLSNLEAVAFSINELFVIILVLVAIYYLSQSSSPEVGTIYMILSYIWRYVASMDEVPHIVQQISKLHDIDHRLKSC